MRDAVVDADDSPKVAARRLENLDEVGHALERFEKTVSSDEDVLGEYLRSSALDRRPKEDKENVGQVTLMTLHSAKGLEFPYVFLVGAEEELLPHRRTLELGGSLEEERRLAYVGITRARVKLWMTWAATRIRYGSPVPRGPSRFIESLPDSSFLVRRSRNAAASGEESEAMASEFFKKMRDQLGID
ncbi:MAG: 3'-5' exonuclease [Myxococcota bacterium]